MFKIKLRNIKGIKKMDFPFPERKGVYVLTGANGSGKTSLLIALCRLGDKMAFTHFKVNTNKTGNIQIDTYKDSSIVYYLIVIYLHKFTISKCGIRQILPWT